VWCGDQPLKEAFPEFLALPDLEMLLWLINLLFSNGSPERNVNFVRTAQDWELDFFLSFLISSIPSN
jgi:hypothetical protein